MRRKTPIGPTQRQLRVGEQIKHIIVETLQRGSFDDALLFDAAHTVTVTEVSVSPDLKQATAYIIKLTGSEMGSMLTALNGEANLFQKEIAKRLQTRFTPKLRFQGDDTFEKSARIEELLHNLPAYTRDDDN
jgi:ribosome-binding factor A